MHWILALAHAPELGSQNFEIIYARLSVLGLFFVEMILQRCSTKSYLQIDVTLMK